MLYSVLALSVFVCGISALSIDDLPIEDQFVSTPFGWYHKACVHEVEHESRIINEPESFFISNPGNYGGTEVYRCLYKHSGEAIRQRMMQLQEYYPSAQFDGSGWQDYTKMDSGDSTDGFYGNWNVPASPSSGGPILYMFTGLQNIDWVPPEREPSKPFDIIQPVMQYGASAAGGGNYWSCASWYVTLTNDVVHGRAFRLSTGDNIYGNMTKTGSDSWYINCLDTNSNQNNAITVTKSLLQTQPWIYVTLEVYGVRNCNEYPAKGTELKFTNLKLTENGSPASINWIVGTNGQQPPVCDSSIKVLSPTAVTITF
jgi:hypothetical protein